jgi:hypothetical protein
MLPTVVCICVSSFSHAGVVGFVQSHAAVIFIFSSWDEDHSTAARRQHTGSTQAAHTAVQPQMQ